MSFNIVKSTSGYYPIMEKLLDAGVAMVHLIPGLLGVRVPPQFKNQPILRLNFSYRFGIDDFQVDERGVRASLSFGGVNYFCDIPWGAVIAISSQALNEKYVCGENFSIEQLAMVISPIEAVQLFKDYKQGKFADMLEEDDDEPGEGFIRLLDDKDELEDDEEDDDEVEDEDESSAEEAGDGSDSEKDEDGEESDEDPDDGDDDDDVPPGGWGPLRLV